MDLPQRQTLKNVQLWHQGDRASLATQNSQQQPRVHALIVPTKHAQEIVIVVKPELRANGSVKTNPDSLIRSSLKLSGVSARVSPHGATSASIRGPGLKSRVATS